MICKKIKLRGKRGIYWEEKGRNGMGKIISHKRVKKKFFQWREKGGGEREKVKLTLITFGSRREQHAHSIWHENLSYTTGK